MKLIPTTIPDVVLLEPEVSSDARGFFYESWNRRTLADLGIDADFVQDNHARSIRNVLRGLHYQSGRHAQGKLIQVITGTIFDVAVDLRRSSPTFGRWTSFTLSSEDHTMAWIPPGFAHGYCVTSDFADCLYKVTEYWQPSAERILSWNDSTLAIPWPIEGSPILAPKDMAGTPLAEAEVYP